MMIVQFVLFSAVVWVICGLVAIFIEGLVDRITKSITTGPLGIHIVCGPISLILVCMDLVVALFTKTNVLNFIYNLGRGKSND